ncbi:MAG: hypothetical protein FJY91_01825 [Candidatus Harrisonbacteria bacterium]|nr:hypothetical protein [Candidatus Harrisonbacteria bacterium]
MRFFFLLLLFFAPFFSFAQDLRYSLIACDDSSINSLVRENLTKKIISFRDDGFLGSNCIFEFKDGKRIIHIIKAKDVNEFQSKLDVLNSRGPTNHNNDLSDINFFCINDVNDLASCGDNALCREALSKNFSDNNVHEKIHGYNEACRMH